MVAPKAKTKKQTRETIKGKSVTSQPPKAIPQKQTKTEIVKAISTATGLSIKDIKSVFIAMDRLAKSHLIKKGSGEFTVPEMGIKVLRKTKPATKKKLGRNPSTGESITIPAKPKREVIKVRPLKSLKSILEAK